MLNITEKTEILLEQIGFCDFRTEQGINKARTLIRRALKKNKVEHSVITLENFINKFAPDKELHQGIELTKDNVYDYCDELFGGDSQYVRGLKSGVIMADESTYSELINNGNKPIVTKDKNYLAQLEKLMVMTSLNKYFEIGNHNLSEDQLIKMSKETTYSFEQLNGIFKPKTNRK